MSLRFHHIGVACRDIDSETARFAAFGYQPEGPDFTDTTHGVSGRFLTGGGPRLELLSAISAEDVLTPWLKAGVKLYHLAYEARDFDDEILRLQGQGARVVVQPLPAVAYGGRRIAFLMVPNMLLIELIAAS